MGSNQEVVLELTSSVEVDGEYVLDDPSSMVVVVAVAVAVAVAVVVVVVVADVAVVVVDIS